MKNLRIFLMLLCISLSTQAQVTLTYETHGLISEDTNPMMLVKFTEPGEGGENMSWDFSKLEIDKNFKGYVEDISISTEAFNFDNANVILEEFGNYFIFNSNKSELVQTGYLSESGKAKIVYDKPIVKLQFPFAYKSVSSGDFSGTYFFDGKEHANISGDYLVEADSYGSLRLPNNIKYDKALRVKTVRDYIQKYKSSEIEIKTTTYRWYVNDIRYPVLVLIESKYNSPGRTSVTYKAAYRDQAITLKSEDAKKKSSVKIYPNPTNDFIDIELSLTTESSIIIELFNLNGEKILGIDDHKGQVGNIVKKMSLKASGVLPGEYILKTTLGKETVINKIVVH